MTKMIVIVVFIVALFYGLYYGLQLWSDSAASAMADCYVESAKNTRELAEKYAADPPDAHLKCTERKAELDSLGQCLETVKSTHGAVQVSVANSISVMKHWGKDPLKIAKKNHNSTCSVYPELQV